MTNTFTQHVCAALLGVAILSSCSRPVAYFQRSPVETLAKTPATTVVESTPAVVEPTELLAKANTTITQLDAYVQNDAKLATNKKLTERMNRVRKLLASTQGTVAVKASNAPQKTTLLERLMLKKINKQLKRQLVANPAEKSSVNPVILIGGIVLLIGGLILLIAGTGTAAFIGLIIALVGALGTILGLFGQ